MARSKKAKVKSNAAGKSGAQSQAPTSKQVVIVKSPQKERKATQPVAISTAQTRKKVTAVTTNTKAIATITADDRNNYDDLLRLRKMIVLLSLLTEVPANPKLESTVLNLENRSQRNSLPPYIFSFDEEKALIGVFTFICSITKNPHKVAALCLEQAGPPSEPALILNIAVNHGESTVLKAGLEVILESLRSACIDLPSRSELVLTKIVHFNCNRILCRLHSRHAKWTKINFAKSKQSRLPLLPRVVQVFNTAASRDHSLIFMESQIHYLQRIYNSLEQLPDTSGDQFLTTLVQLVNSISGLWYQSKFRNLFLSNPLSSALAKLARYKSAAVFLINRFQNSPSLRSMKVATIRLQPVGLPAYQPFPGEVQSLITNTLGQNTNKNLLQQMQSARHTALQKLRTISDDTFKNKVNTPCPVHAEIQLLFHYELRPSITWPRIILSTKKPCYLCSLFFQLHGQYYIPKSHGRLYDKWTLPQAINDLRGPQAASARALITRFQNTLIDAARTAAVASKKSTTMSLESLFMPSAIWARLQSGPPSSRPSRITSRGPSKTRNLPINIKPSPSDSSIETIKAFRSPLPQNQPSDHNIPSPSTLSTNASITLIPRSSNQPPATFNPLHHAHSTNALPTPPHPLRQGTSTILTLPPTPQVIDPSIRTRHLDISFSHTTETLHKPGYVIVHNNSAPLQPHATTAPTVRVRDLVVGEDKRVDLTVLDYGACGIVLEDGVERLYLRYWSGF